MSQQQQSDTHSVSSGLSNTTTPMPPTTSSSVISSSSQQQQQQQQQQPPVPVVQNPFETLSTIASPMPGGINPTTTTAVLPISQVTVTQMLSQPPPPPSSTKNTIMMMSSPPQQQLPLPSSSNAAAVRMGPSQLQQHSSNTPLSPPLSSSSVPNMGSQHSNGTIPIVPSVLLAPAPLQQQSVYTTTTTTTTTTSTDFPMYDHPPCATSGQQFPMTDFMGGTTISSYPTPMTNHNNNDYIFDDDENTVPSSLGNTTTDDQLSQNQQQQQRTNHPYYHRQSSSSNNALEFDPTSASNNFPTTIGNSSFTSRIIESTKRFITNSNNSSNNDLNPDSTVVNNNRTTTTANPVRTTDGGPSSNCLIAGYLQKLGRNQKWQTRWFETNGIYLSYYKSSKRNNVLASLDLQKVGLIEMDTDDKTEHSFRIQVLGRLYQLRANSRASCQDWVITLNRVKEARMQQGNVKLVGVPGTSTTTKRSIISNIPLDLLNPSASATTSQKQSHQMLNDDSENNNFLDGTPRVVVVSNRERTHGVDEEDQWDQLIRIDDNNNNIGSIYSNHNNNTLDVDPAGSQVETIYSGSSKRLSSIGTVVAARWTKHQSKMQRLGNKFSKWARSIKKYSCTDNNDAVIITSGVRPHGDVVHLDKYLHPPGHDDKLQKQQQQQQQQQAALLKMQSLPSTTTSSNTTTNTLPLPINATSTTLSTSATAATVLTSTSNHFPMISASSTTAISTNSTTSATAAAAAANIHPSVIMMNNKPLAIHDRSTSSASDYDARMLS